MTAKQNSLEKVNLFLKAEDLPKVQTFSNTDPFAVVYFKEPSGALQRVANTELIKDTNNPNWATSITVDYMFEVVQEVVVKVFHSEDNKPLADEGKHSLLGEVTFLLSDLVRAFKGLSLNLTGGKHTGKLVAKAEAQVNTRDLFAVTFAGQKLANKDGFFGTSDPFLDISRLNEDGSYSVVWTSPKIDNTLSPKWAETKIAMTSLCNGDLDRPLRINLWDWDSNGKHASMGSANTSVRAMLSNNGAGMEVIEHDKKDKKGYTNSGHVTATNTRIEHYPTFTEFVQGGCEINMIVAIDFTGSNGDPTSPDSLHYVDPSGKLNPYQSAITSVGNVLQQYDTDKKYTVFGFGARIRLPSGEFTPVQHCFPVYGGGSEVSGIDGILKAYQECHSAVMMSGPTLFAPLVGGAAYLANAGGCTQEKQKYTLLLVITDGTVNDLDATMDVIIAASNEPMSIVIIGVGADDFSEMKVLDSDKQLLKHGGKTASRDIVQFVLYREAAARGAPVLAQQVLAEIPDQVLKYMEQHKITPHKRS